ncbi:MAG: 3-phosphoshikimate 1-carboxyvinyltransferase, partial [Gammaproteobacteria bacterium]
MRDFLITPGGKLTGRIRVPGDKSISHRALIFGAIAEGTTHVSGFLESTDCIATRKALQKMGVKFGRTSAGAEMTVQGRGLQGLHAPATALDLGNSGTAMRLLCGLLAGQAFISKLTGDESLRRRPMRRVIEPLARMGASIDSVQGCAPLTIHGSKRLKPLRYELPVASAQVKSALLLSGLNAEGYTWLREPHASRDHTERMLDTFGSPCLRVDGWLGVHGGTPLKATHVEVPGDLSSAAFFMVGAAIQRDSHLVLEQVGVNPTRSGVITLLRKMGTDIKLSNERLAGAEPVADIEIETATLHGIRITPDQVPLAIDELPALMIAAALARGDTVLEGAAELRVKESDRLQAMADGLRMLGVEVELWADGMRLSGVEALNGGEVDSCGDHRIAMAFAMAGLRARAPIRIRDCRNVETSFPGFVAAARASGLELEEVQR